MTNQEAAVRITQMVATAVICVATQQVIVKIVKK